MNPVALSRFLGMFSLALGVVEVAVPQLLARRLGVWGGSWLVRAFGAREIAAGFTVLKDPSQIAGPASRLGGDALDIAVLLPAVLPGRYRRGAARLALLAVVGVTVLDAIAAAGLAANEKDRAETARRTRWVRPAT